MTILLSVLVIAALVLLAYLQVSHVRAVRVRRGALFDQVTHLFNEVKIRQDGLNYPVLTGRLHGHPIKLEPIVDTLGFRKLPVLWLLITHYRPLPVGSPLDVLLRPHGNEFFSPNQRYEREIPPGPGYPEHIRIASRDPEAAPDLAVLAPFLRFIREMDTKEILVQSTGIRVVRRLAEAEQAHYRVTRRVELHPNLTETILAPVLSTLTALGDAFAAPSVPGRAEWRG